MTSLKFGEVLAKNLNINPEELEKALKYQKQYGGRLGEILLHSGVLNEEQIAQALSMQFGIKDIKTEIKDFADLALEPTKDIAPDWFIINEILPLFEEKHKMYFLIKDPLNFFPQEAVRQIFSEFQVQFLLADERKYREMLNMFKHKHSQKAISEFSINEIEKLRDMAGEAPIIKFVNAMINRAADYRASDIHVENQDNSLKIRYRIDGVLTDIDVVSSDVAPAIISRLKIMSNLDIGEKRLPQDGRIQIKVSGKLFDIRVSTIPSIHGENVVMRLLEKENINYNISSLGLSDPDVAVLKELVANNFGLILVTGPTGSGKSTTLYSLLNSMNMREKKIITVEDPVEYQIPGITQIHVHEQIGLTFATILRNILRQDPDIIMIGEIRDRETAEIAIQSSLTGHLVLATLHTNDSVSAITRLVDMGVDTFLINSSLLGVLAQRLVRRICPICRTPEPMLPHYAHEVNLDYMKNKFGFKEFQFHRGRGCELCANTGFRERIGVFEILRYTDEIKSLMLETTDYEKIKRRLNEKNFKTLREDAVLKWINGITTLEEVFRVT
jgi:type II secretory ATPase GspE/PulE/Tfp pilus assembly ATPase PilB-like protein